MYITYVEVCLLFQRVLKGRNFYIPYTKGVYSKLTLISTFFQGRQLKEILVGRNFIKERTTGCSGEIVDLSFGWWTNVSYQANIPWIHLNSWMPIFVVWWIKGVIVWWLDLQLSVQSVPITTKVVSSNLVHGEMYSIQYYVIKFVSDLWQVCGFLWVLRFPPPIKLTATI